MKRRDFMTSTAIGMGAFALNGCYKEESKKGNNVTYQKKVTLKLATSWPAHFPIMGTGVDNFAKRCFELSGGSLEKDWLNSVSTLLTQPKSIMPNILSAMKMKFPGLGSACTILSW